MNCNRIVTIIIVCFALFSLSLQSNFVIKRKDITFELFFRLPTEFELLRQLLTNRGKVLSRQQLMDTVWVGVVVTDRTVDVHITRLRKKLGVYANNIVSRPGFGYVFEE